MFKKKGTMSWVLDFSRLNLSAHVPEEYERQISTRRKETTENFKTSQGSKTKHRTEATKLRTKTNNCPAKPKKDRPKYRFTTGSPRVHRRFTTGSTASTGIRPQGLHDGGHGPEVLHREGLQRREGGDDLEEGHGHAEAQVAQLQDWHTRPFFLAR